MRVLRRVGRSVFCVLRATDLKPSGFQPENVDERQAPRQARGPSTCLVQQSHRSSVAEAAGPEQAEWNEARRRVGCVGNAPTLVQWTSALQAARDLYAATNPEDSKKGRELHADAATRTQRSQTPSRQPQVPAGTPENSPAFQRWDCCAQPGRVPPGMAEKSIRGKGAGDFTQSRKDAKVSARLEAARSLHVAPLRDSLASLRLCVISPAKADNAKAARTPGLPSADRSAVVTHGSLRTPSLPWRPCASGISLSRSFFSRPGGGLHRSSSAGSSSIFCARFAQVSPFEELRP
jgi:hypothetical protein